MFAVTWNYPNGTSQLCVFNAGYYGDDRVSMEPADLDDAASVWIVPGTIDLETI